MWFLLLIRFQAEADKKAPYVVYVAINVKYTPNNPDIIIVVAAVRSHRFYHRPAENMPAGEQHVCCDGIEMVPPVERCPVPSG